MPNIFHLFSSFDLKLFVPPPDFETRLELFKLKLKDVSHTLASEEDFEVLALESRHLVSSDILEVLKEVEYIVVRELMQEKYFKKVSLFHRAIADK